jgi:Dickkopf N-terminal cysteine-rich region
LAGTCATPGKDDATCAGATGNVCALGWNCWNGTNSTAGTCQTNADTLINAENAACEPGSKLCKEGLSCVFDGAGDFHCEARVASGAACHRGQPGQCPAGEFCDTANPMDVTVAGTCKPLPGDGEECAFPGACAPGMVCVPETTSTALCRPIHDNGGACKIDDACRSGYCNAAKCEPPPLCN